MGGCCGTDDSFISAIKRAAEAFGENIADAAGDLPTVPHPSELICTNRKTASVTEFRKALASSEKPEPIAADDDLADNAADLEDDGAALIYIAVNSDQEADTVIDNLPYIHMPMVLTGDKAAIAKVKRVYNGKLGMA